MIKFKPSDGSETRSAEIARELKKLDVEMASPNIKESRHAELNVIYRQLSAERDVLTSR